MSKLSSQSHWTKAFYDNQYSGWNTARWVEHQNNAADYVIRKIKNLSVEYRIQRVLEIGSGSGNFIIRLANNLSDLTFCASDFISPAVNQIKKDVLDKSSFNNIYVINLDAQLINHVHLKDFDVIVSIGLASALSNDKIFDHVCSQLTPGKIIITDLINHLQPTFLIKPHKSLVNLFRFFYRGFSKNSKTYYFYKFGIKDKCKKNGLKIISLETNSFYFGLRRPLFLIAIKE